MKKEILFLMFGILIQLTLASAVSYKCSDNSSISTDSEEISEGKVSSIRGLKIGLCNSYENNIHKFIESTIFIDSNIITLENNTMISEIKLKQFNGTIKYSNATNNDATITLGSSSEELEIGDCYSLGGLNVKIESITGEGSTAIIDVLVGYTKKVLNTKQNSSEIVTINSKQYGITLTGGSSNSASVSVSTCRTGDLTQIVEIINTTNSTNLNQTNITNTTSNNATNIENQTQVIQNTTIKECESTGQRNSTQYCNTEGKYINQSSSGQSCSNDYECISNSCKNGLCANKSLFSRIIAWIKDIFN